LTIAAEPEPPPVSPTAITSCTSAQTFIPWLKVYARARRSTYEVLFVEYEVLFL
jgi:hypothetical protein